MALLFGSSREERQHVASVLRSLGPTSVPGLAAALSWSERRTEKAVRELVHDGVKGLRYDPIRRTVALPAPTVPRPPVAASPEGSGADGLAPSPAPSLSAGPTGGRTPRGWPGAAKCPACATTMEATATGEALVCPRCGRLALRPRASPPATAAPAPRAEVSGAPKAAPRAPAPGPGAAGTLDRKSQELFAAWVTDRPIPCPKCRRTLQHRGVRSYVCTGCGETVQFRDDGRIERSVPPAPAA